MYTGCNCFVSIEFHGIYSLTQKAKWDLFPKLTHRQCRWLSCGAVGLEQATVALAPRLSSVAIPKWPQPKLSKSILRYPLGTQVAASVVFLGRHLSDASDVS